MLIFSWWQIKDWIRSIPKSLQNGSYTMRNVRKNGDVSTKCFSEPMEAATNRLCISKYCDEEIFGLW